MPLNLPIQGNNQVSSWPVGWDVRDVYDSLVTLDSAPSAYAFDQLLRASRVYKKATNIVQEYYRRDAEIPFTTTTTDASAGNLAGATQTIPVANAAIFLVDEKVVYQTAVGVRHVGVITAINYGTNVLTVGTLNPAAGGPGNVTNANYRTPIAFGVGAIAGDETPVYRLGPAKSEFHGPSGTNRNLPQLGTNLVAAYDCRIVHSTHAKLTGNYTEREAAIYEREKKESYRRAINRDLYMSRKGIFLKDGNLVHTFDGLLAHGLPTYSTALSGFDEGKLIDIAYAASEGNAGSSSRIVLAGATAKKAMDKVMLTKMEHAETRTVAGVELTGIRAADINLQVTWDRTLDSLGMSNRAFLVDPAYQGRAEMESYNEVDLTLRESGVADGSGTWGFEKFCPLFMMPEACLDITLTS